MQPPPPPAPPLPFSHTPACRSRRRAVLVVAGLCAVVLVLFLVLHERASRAGRGDSLAAQDMAQLTSRQLQQTYARLLGERRMLLQERMQRLEQTAAMARRLAAFAMQDARRQALPPRETQDHAGTLALALLDDVFLEPGLLCFVYDARITALTYPELALRGLDLSPYRDRRGRSLLRVLREESLQWGSTMAMFDWKARGAARMTTHLGMAVNLPEFNWTLAVFLDMDDALRRERALRAAEAQALLDLLGQTHAAREAIFCLLDQRGRLLGAPVTRLLPSSRLAQAATSANMLGNAEVQSRLLVAALAETPVVLDELPGDPGRVEVLGVQHAALGWTLVRLTPVPEVPWHWLWLGCALVAAGCILLIRGPLQPTKDRS